MTKITVCTSCHTQSREYQGDPLDRGDAYRVNFIEHCEECGRVFDYARSSFLLWMHKFGLSLAGEAGHLALIITNDANSPLSTMTEAQASIYCQARGWPTAGIGPAFAAYREWLQRHPERSP